MRTLQQPESTWRSSLLSSNFVLQNLPFTCDEKRRPRSKRASFCHQAILEDAGKVSRRITLEATLIPTLTATAFLVQSPACLAAGDSKRRGIGRYIKKKKLDPLESYVPAVIAAKKQLQRSGAMMKDNLQGARELLRNGAFDGLRDNIRALGDYAQQAGAKDGKKLPDKFFLSVEGFDYTLFQSKRNDQPVGPESEKALEQAVASIDALLATVPQNVLEDSAKIVEAVEGSFKAQPAAPKEGSDKQLDQLMQLVPTQAS